VSPSHILFQPLVRSVLLKDQKKGRKKELKILSRTYAYFLQRYWGKRDTSLNLPTNSSLSVTLSQKSLRTLTTASCSSTYTGADTLTLNGTDEDIASSKRTQACLQNLKRLRAALEAKDSSLPVLSKMPLKLVSANNFPTAAGLASSAAGFAALVRAIADLYSLPQSPTELSLIARQGSGSACRSLMGGYVAWRAGTAADGSDSIAEEVAPSSHWPEMRALILVVSADKKSIGSTEGMQSTVQTSQLFPSRLEVVPKRMAEMEKAIASRDFETFARVTMQDSNTFHACCLDSWPPIQYLNDVSKAAMDAVNTINRRAGKLICAYTFDAGPNAVIYYLEENTHKVAGIFRHILINTDGWEGEYGSLEAIKPNEMTGLDAKVLRTIKAGISRVICTGVGGAPERLESHLVDDKGMAVEV
jgi:diphosphomevalonate decarboxylase